MHAGLMSDRVRAFLSVTMHANEEISTLGDFVMVVTPLPMTANDPVEN
jgi:hypothetical protein